LLGLGKPRSNGCALPICGVRGIRPAEPVADEIVESGGDAFGLAVDVADPDQNNAMAGATVERYGALHIAVLNAGVPSAMPILDIPVEEWDRVLGIILRGTFLGIQSCGRKIAV
jgi:NAD(P)-dependent dehydrogenase (short-subunit alcohol dehydrogenase family)